MKVSKIMPLLMIIILAIFLRFWQLGDIPPGAHSDEIDTGYSAYSLLKTGLDPQGKFNLFALSDTAAGGVHPPIYTYLLIPLIKCFGLNIYIIRLPSAILGSISVLLVYFLVKKLFNSKASALLSSLFFAVNPWAIHISRQGLLEAESLFFVLLGIVLFLYVDRKKIFLIFSAFSFGLSLYAYDAPKIFLPLFLPLLFYFYRNIIFKIKKYLIIFIFIFSLFYASILYLTFFRGEINDYSRSSVFNSLSTSVDEERFKTNSPLWLSSVIHNKLTTSIKRFITSYSNVFSLNWLFINGGNNLQRSVGNHGQFYLFELPFFFIGLFLIFKKNTNLAYFLLGWMLIGAVPGGVTNGNYVYRSIHMLPIPIIFSCAGVIWFWKLLNTKIKFYKIFLKLITASLITIYILSYMFTYFFDYPVYASEYWGKQQNDTIKYVVKNKNKYDYIFVNEEDTWAISYAFFNKTDPLYFQSAFKNREYFKNIKVIKIENVYFGNFNLKNAENLSNMFPKNSLFVTNAGKFPETNFIKAFYGPSRIRIIFKVFEVK